MASYRKNIRLHLKPYLGAVPLRTLTTARIDTVYRELERSGRRDHKGKRRGRAAVCRCPVIGVGRREDDSMVAVGIDSHKHVHVAVAVDDDGRPIGKPLTVKNDAILIISC